MPKIDPYCAFTINLGPLYVERVFDRLLTLQGVKNIVLMPNPARFELYLQYLHREVSHTSLRRYSFIQFYLAHFSQQLANLAASSHLKEKAICHYETYLELAEDIAESRFYAQWQVALLQEELGYPWSQTEPTLLKATTYDSQRGEPIKNLIDRYCLAKSWKTAHSLSNLAMKTYFEKNPAATRRWFIDFSAYDWHLLQNHLTICYELGRVKEASQTYRQLSTYSTRHPEEPIPFANLRATNASLYHHPALH